jgi:uncharacterized membrane protein YeaQ/YmgE (transglycosylase-associated protein family)
MDITTIIIDVIAGAIGGNATGAAAKQYSLGPVGNSIAGVIGGVISGWIVAKFFGGAAPPADAAAAVTAVSMNIGQVIEQAVGGLVGGGILQVIVGLIKQQTSKA